MSDLHFCSSLAFLSVIPFGSLSPFTPSLFFSFFFTGSVAFLLVCSFLLSLSTSSCFLLLSLSLPAGLASSPLPKSLDCNSFHAADSAFPPTPGVCTPCLRASFSSYCLLPFSTTERVRQRDNKSQGRVEKREAYLAQSRVPLRLSMRVDTYIEVHVHVRLALRATIANWSRVCLRVDLREATPRLRACVCRSR